ncbi:orotate phosphoribosyltransferase [Caldisphaera lagunensis DSM 15908]|uniref:Orotate phosphoribosyltransferase n=1 Tax=Caldisphaera lagunensis (strain DSM 15908 / JCM 11604 / ANMR 0165 / IC-154) TaxID=1056495 RepID=L0AC87_CALLD|nr:orotate phosphoribosyltransferase [Caldisphaera lagunensis]AFZ70747.1 orotate phosphoribosyltransferase [Caldisphaera lagunensis DSM 15908]
MQEIDVISKILYETGSIKIGKFLLASGKYSSIYVDMRKMLGNVDGFKRIGNLLSQKVNEIKKVDNIDVIIGVATGGIPWASVTSYLINLPMAYVRQQKGHGLNNQIEGADVVNKHGLIIDDVSTTGESLINSAKTVRENKGIVNYSLVIVDRGQGSIENLRKENINLHYLFTLKQILESLLKQNIINDNTFNNIINELYG